MMKLRRLPTRRALIKTVGSLACACGVSKSDIALALATQRLSSLSSEERSIIKYLERDKKRKLSPQEVNLALAQARSVGMLD